VKRRLGLHLLPGPAGPFEHGGDTAELRVQRREPWRKPVRVPAAGQFDDNRR